MKGQEDSPHSLVEHFEVAPKASGTHALTWNTFSLYLLRGRMFLNSNQEFLPKNQMQHIGFASGLARRATDVINVLGTGATSLGFPTNRTIESVREYTVLC